MRHFSLLRSLMQFWRTFTITFYNFYDKMTGRLRGEVENVPGSGVLHLAWKAGANAALSPCKVCFISCSSPIRTKVCDSNMEPWVGHEFSVASMLKLSELKFSKDVRAFLSQTFTYTCHEPHHLVSTTWIHRRMSSIFWHSTARTFFVKSSQAESLSAKIFSLDSSDSSTDVMLIVLRCSLMSSSPASPTWWAVDANDSDLLS